MLQADYLWPLLNIHFMVYYPYLLDILKYTIAGLGVVWIAFYLIKPYLDKSERIQLLEFKKSVSN